MKTVLLFGAGKSATVLIEYLITESESHGWRFIVADANKEQILLKTHNSPFAEAIELDIRNEEMRAELIELAHVVISMLPADLHFGVAKDCVEYKKHLLTASYLDNKIKSLRDEVHLKKLIFLCEMGLDPGIDHMSAMRLIDRIRAKNGKITSFKSHCGGLVAPEDDNNPWRYKISWNPRNVVLAGKAGAQYKLNDTVIAEDYENLFRINDLIHTADESIDALSFYPNRDSLSYLQTYHLPDIKTFVRTTLRYPDFLTGWHKIIELNLTDETPKYETDGMSLQTFFETHLQNEQKKIDESDALFVSQMEFLGRNDDVTLINKGLCSAADVLQFALETKLKLQPDDKDMIVMLHEIEYELNNETKKCSSTLIVKGTDGLHTAMAKTVGLPLGIAAKLILTEQLPLKGLLIPTQPEIYEPVLDMLAEQGIGFEEKF